MELKLISHEVRYNPEKDCDYIILEIRQPTGETTLYEPPMDFYGTKKERKKLIKGVLKHVTELLDKENKENNIS